MKSWCAECKVGLYAQRKPDTVIGKLWRWHTKWCPFWKAYQRELATEEQQSGSSQALGVHR